MTSSSPCSRTTNAAPTSPACSPAPASISSANPERSATLDGALIFSRPADVVRAVAGQFRLNLADRTIRKIVEGPVFNADSKDPTKPFDHEAYQRQRAATKAALEPEILEARRWLDA